MWVEDLAEEDRAAIAELRHEVPKLVSSVGERDRLGMLRHTFTGKNLDALRARQPIGVEAKLQRELAIEPHEPRRGNRRRLGTRKEPFREPSVAVVERKMKRHCCQRGSTQGP